MSENTLSERIVACEAEVEKDWEMRDPDGLWFYVEVVVDERLFLTGESGTVYMVEPLRGEGLGALERRYAAGAMTDDRCIPMIATA
jgi:hypothetical protein